MSYEPIPYSKNERAFMEKLRSTYELRDSEILRQCLHLAGYIFYTHGVQKNGSLAEDFVEGLSRNEVSESELRETLVRIMEARRSLQSLASAPDFTGKDLHQ